MKSLGLSLLMLFIAVLSVFFIEYREANKVMIQCSQSLSK